MKTAKFLKIFGALTAGLGFFLLIAGVDETEALTDQVLKSFLTIKAFGFAFFYIGGKAFTAGFDKEETDSNN